MGLAPDRLCLSAAEMATSSEISIPSSSFPISVSSAPKLSTLQPPRQPPRWPRWSQQPSAPSSMKLGIRAVSSSPPTFHQDAGKSHHQRPALEMESHGHLARMTRSMQATVNTPLRNVSQLCSRRRTGAREKIHKGDSAFAKDEAHIRAPTAAETIQASSTRLLSPASLEMFVHSFSSREIAIENFENRVM